MSIDWSKPLVCDLGDGSPPLRVAVVIGPDRDGHYFLSNIDRNVPGWTKQQSRWFAADHGWCVSASPIRTTANTSLWRIRNL